MHVIIMWKQRHIGNKTSFAGGFKEVQLLYVLNINKYNFIKLKFLKNDYSKGVVAYPEKKKD